MSTKAKKTVSADYIYYPPIEGLDLRFKDLLPPLSDKERGALATSICTSGCLAPIVLWEDPTLHNKVLVDGFNRYAICVDHKLPLKAVHLSNRDNATFADVERWIIINQLGRRNLTDAQREEFIGRLYNTEKNDKAKNLKKSTNLPKGQNVLSGEKVGATVPVARPRTTDNKAVDTTAQKIAKEHGVSDKTVQRAAKFTDAVARVEKVSPEAASKIRNEKSVLPRGEVRALADAPEEAVKQAAKAIVEDKPLAPKPKPPAPKPAPVVGATLAVARSSETPKFQTLDGQIFRMVEEIRNRLEVLDELLPRRGELRGECMESVPNIMRSLQHDANNTLRCWMGDSAITTIIDHIAGGCAYLEKLLDGDLDGVKGKKLADYNIEEIIAGVKSNLTAHNILLRHAVVVRDKRGGGNGGNV